LVCGPSIAVSQLQRSVAMMTNSSTTLLRQEMSEVVLWLPIMHNQPNAGLVNGGRPQIVARRMVVGIQTIPRPIRLDLFWFVFSQRIIFFSHIKLADSTFSHGL